MLFMVLFHVCRTIFLTKKQMNIHYSLPKEDVRKSDSCDRDKDQVSHFSIRVKESGSIVTQKGHLNCDIERIARAH